MTDIIAPKKKNIVLDATTLSTVMGCGRLTDFRFNYHFQPIDGKSNNLETGSIIHTGLEFYYQAIIDGMTRKDAVQYGMAAAEMYIRGCAHCTDFKPSYCEVHDALPEDEREKHVETCKDCFPKPPCNHNVDQFPGVKNTPPDNQSKPSRIGWKHCLSTLEQYFEFYKNDFWVPLEVEKVRGKILYEDDEIRILWKAKLDLVADTNSGIYPIDHKTMRQRRDTNSLNNQFIGQCLVMETRQTIINKIGFQESLKPSEKFTRVPVPYPIDVLMEWQTEILPYWAYQIVSYNETGYWPPNFDHCDNKYGQCIFTDVCKAPPSLRNKELQIGFVVGPVWDPTNDD